MALAGCGGSGGDDGGGGGDPGNRPRAANDAADAADAAREIATALESADCEALRARLHPIVRQGGRGDCRTTQALSRSSQATGTADSAKAYGSGALARLGTASGQPVWLLMLRDMDRRFKFVTLSSPSRDTPLPLSDDVDATVEQGVTRLSHDDCEGFFNYFSAYEPGGNTPALVCKLKWLRRLLADLRRSRTVPSVKRLGGDGYYAFYEIALKEGQAWTALLGADEDGFYRVMTAGRSR
jgi:hypothetical protein